MYLCPAANNGGGGGGGDPMPIYTSIYFQMGMDIDGHRLKNSFNENKHSC